MGSWGFEPYENDTAADWFGDKLEALSEEVEKALNSDDYEVIRAGAYILQRLGQNYVYPRMIHFDTAIDALNEIKSDEEWINDWVDSEQIRVALQNQINELTEMRGE